MWYVVTVSVRMCWKWHGVLCGSVTWSVVDGSVVCAVLCGAVWCVKMIECQGCDENKVACDTVGVT